MAKDREQRRKLKARKRKEKKARKRQIETKIETRVVDDLENLDLDPELVDYFADGLANEPDHDVLFANIATKLRENAPAFFGFLHRLAEVDTVTTKEAAQVLEEMAEQVIHAQGSEIGFETEAGAKRFEFAVQEAPSVEAKAFALSRAIKAFGDGKNALTDEQVDEVITNVASFASIMKITPGLNPDERWAVYKEAGRMTGLRDEEPIGAQGILDELNVVKMGNETLVLSAKDMPPEAREILESKGKVIAKGNITIDKSDNLEDIIQQVERAAGWKEGEKPPRTIIAPGFGVKDGKYVGMKDDDGSTPLLPKEITQVPQPAIEKSPLDGPMKLHKLADGMATMDDISNREWLREFREVETFRSDCDSDSTQATLESYMMLCSWLLEDTRKDRSTFKLGSAGVKEHKRVSSAVWAKMRNARIFHFTFEQFTTIYHGADTFTTEEIAGMDWKGLGEDSISKTESAHHQKSIVDSGLVWPFPEHLPFDNVFIGLGAGVPLTPTQFFLRMPMDRAKEAQIVAAKLMGYLVTVQGDVIEFMVTKNLPDTLGMYYHPKRAGAGLRQAGGGSKFVGQPLGNWDGPYDLTPWIIGGLIQSINDHRTVIVEGEGRLARRVHWRKRAKEDFRIQHIPPPYYTVTIRARTIREDLHRKWKSDKKRKLAYQTDRRGHERVFVARGPLPMSDKKRKKFERREITTKGKQKIYESLRPDEETNRLLLLRGHAPKRSDEWMVVLVTWVDDHKVPAEREPGMPYIPSIRKVPRVKEGNASWEGKKMRPTPSSRKSASSEV